MAKTRRPGPIRTPVCRPTGMPEKGRMRRMRYVHVDVPHLTVGLMDDQHLLGRLNEIDQLDAPEDVEGGNAGRPAPLLGGEWHAAGEHAVIDLLQALDNPGLQDRIAEVRDPVRRLALPV